MADAHKNFAYSLVFTPPSPALSGTALSVYAGHGALFPAVPFNATVFPVGSDPTAANAEIIRVTGKSTDDFAFVRAQEGTTAKPIAAGYQIVAGITAKSLTDAEGYVISAGMGAWNPADGAVSYWGAYPPIGSVTTANLTRIPIQKAGVIRRITIAVFITVNGSGESTTLVLRKNNADAVTITTAKLYNMGAVSQSIVTYTTDSAAVALALAVDVGDTIEFKETAPTWVTNPTGIYQRAEILVSGS